MTQQRLDIGAPEASDEHIAREHARRNGWRFVGWHTAVDLLGQRTPVAEFLDGKGRMVYRGLDALKLARSSQG